MDTALSPSPSLIARNSLSLLAGLHGDRAASTGLSPRMRVVSDSLCEFENKRRVAAETWDRCGEPFLPVIDRAPSSHKALRASAKNSRLPHFRFMLSTPLARAAPLALTLLASVDLHAVNYYWDNNDSTIDARLMGWRLTANL